MRELARDDAAAAARVCQAAIRGIPPGFHEPALQEHWATILDAARLRELMDEQTLVGAFEEDILLGIGSLDAPKAELGLLYVDPAHGGQGIGRRLTEAVAELARAAGLETLWIDASLNAVAAYQAFGFEDLGIVERTDPTGQAWRGHRMRMHL
ncbi:MAG: GNAT family N-acetyltransferase [Thermoplasmatota archaeon]